MELLPTQKRDGIVIYEGGLLVTGSDDPSENGIRAVGWIAVRTQGGVWQYPPFGFDDTPSRALADLEAQL